MIYLFFYLSTTYKFNLRLCYPIQMKVLLSHSQEVA